MSDEEQGGSGGGLKNAIIGLITIIVTAITGIVAKNVMGGDEASTPAPVAAPSININLENNVKTGGGSGGTAAPAPAPKKKDSWLQEEPKW
jgi:hypothetical protein